MSNDPSTETLADASQLNAADGGVTVESPALTLVELNKHLGADFKDTATALQSLKETKNFVGKRKEDIAAEVRAGLQQNASDVASKSDVQALNNRLFFSENPQYKGYESLITRLGQNPAEVVTSEEFKSVFEKAKVADEVAQSKSIVSSNARISQTKSILDDAVTVTNARGSTNEDTALVFARAINEANNQG